MTFAASGASLDDWIDDLFRRRPAKPETTPAEAGRLVTANLERLNADEEARGLEGVMHIGASRRRA